MTRTALLLALMGLLTIPLTGCPSGDDDDSSVTDDDDSTGDDDDSTGDDDDSGGDDDDATGDDDDSAGDDDDSAGDDDDSGGDDDDSAGDDDDSAGDDDDSASNPVIPLPVYGVWDDTSGFHAVTDHSWLMFASWGTGRFNITQSDAGGWLIAQNDAGNSFGANLWSKFEWFEASGQLYYCQSTFDAADESAAVSATAADQSNINQGCGGFGWSTLDTTTTAIEAAGVNVDSWSTEHTVTDTTWTQVSSFGTGIFAISQFDNTTNWAVAQNDASNSFSPNLWSRFDWSWDAGDLYVCQTAYDAADEATALATTPANAGDLAAGCGGFAWSLLTP